jgi:hypothetical protein
MSLQNPVQTQRVGTWERNFETHETYWSSVTKEILELPQSFEPGRTPSLNFYKEGPDREKGKKLLYEAFTNGTPFDAQLTLVTAQGKEKLVRIVGLAEKENGVCKKIYGIFQEVFPV